MAKKSAKKAAVKADKETAAVKRRIADLKATVTLLLAERAATGPASAAAPEVVIAAVPEGPSAASSSAGPAAVRGWNDKDYARLKTTYVGTKGGQPAVSESHTMDRTSAFLWWLSRHNADSYGPNTDFPADVMDDVTRASKLLRNEYFDDVGCNLRQPDLVAAKTYIKLWQVIHGNIRNAHKLP